MKINQLVKIWILPKKEEFLGIHDEPSIGVITRILKTKIEVKFLTDYYMKFNPDQIYVLPLQYVKTVGFSDYKKKTF